jgi:hypothetical protein
MNPMECCKVAVLCLATGGGGEAYAVRNHKNIQNFQVILSQLGL